MAERPPSRLSGLRSKVRQGWRKVLSVAWPGCMLALFLAMVMAGCAALGFGPAWFDQAAAVTISTAYATSLAVRTGGRPIIFGCLALALGLLAVISDVDLLRTGAAVMTAVSASVLGVMGTRPAVRFRGAVRELGVVLLISGIGAFGVVGYRPVVALDRFDYVALALSFALAAVLVYNLGAGLHGLGKRGAIVVVVGSVGVAIILAYAELLRRYGAPGFVNDVLDVVRWMRENLGAAPKPVQALVGIPAILWGCHVRARRRQGWWVCAFGVALTTSVASLLINPVTGWFEAVLIVVYSAIPGIAVGYALIRIDLALTGPRGRRARREEEESALRPEPSRFLPLL
nr:hypothetical protein [Nocardioides daedukensis]